MKLFLFGVFLCICASQVYGGFKTYADMKKFCDENPNEELTADEVIWDNQLYSSIKGISPQAYNDFSKITKKQCLIYHPLKGFTTELLPNNLKSGKITVNDEFFQNFLQSVHSIGLLEAEANEFIADLEKIPADQVEPAKRDRFITYFKGFSRGATLDDVKATFSYLYGQTY